MFKKKNQQKISLLSEYLKAHGEQQFYQFL